MNGTSVVTNCGIAPRREVLVPGDEESSAAASLHGLRNSLNPWPLRTEEGTIVQPHLIPLRDVEIPAPMVITVNPRQVLKDGVRRAFFGRTDSIDDALWNGVRARLRNMTLGEARGIWQTIANEVAVDCFGEDGEIDVVKLRRWMEFLGDAENFRTEPYRFIPHAELMRSQMHRVCECLWTNKNGSRDRLDAANGIPVGEHGQSILATMSNGREPPLRPAEVIVASLFTPHRQEALPTCAICSLINAEIRNHPERLIKMYTQMLSSDQFTFPSGYAVRQQPIVDGFITIDLANGGKGRDIVFEDITGGDPAKIAERIARWQQAGIKYVESANPAEKYKFEMPIHNMNDVLFVHFFQASNFGNRKMDLCECGTMRIYAGKERRIEIFPSTIRVGGSNFLAGIAELKEQAETQRQLGHRYMRVSTRSSDGNHAENIDIDALLALDLDHMEPGKAYPIGDRNCGGRNVLCDIRRLAVKKTDGTPPTHEFGTLWYGSRYENGSQFENIHMSIIRVYATEINTEIERFDSRGFLSVFWHFLCRRLYQFLSLSALVVSVIL